MSSKNHKDLTQSYGITDTNYTPIKTLQILRILDASYMMCNNC